MLVRHGSTSWSGLRYCGRSDPPLTATGLEEAESLALALAPTLPTIARIVSSPSRRAVATAEALARAAGGRTIERDPRWLETDFGDAEGLLFDELAVRFPELATQVLAGSTEIDWPNGEPAAQLRARVRSAWDDLRAVGQDVLVVSHAGPLLHALALVRGAAATFGEVPAPGTSVRVTVPARRLDRPPVLGSRT